MQQVKIFKGIEHDLSSLEEEINRWLTEHKEKVRILQMTGNIAPQTGGEKSSGGALGTGAFASSDVLVILLYEKDE